MENNKDYKRGYKDCFNQIVDIINQGYVQGLLDKAQFIDLLFRELNSMKDKFDKEKQDEQY